MKRLRFLLLDANIVIHLFRLGLWSRIVEACDVLLARTVAEEEAHFYEDDDGVRQDFDLGPDIEANRIKVVDVAPGDVSVLRDRFNPLYLEKLDPGETESLAYLANSADPCQLCSGDAIVFRVLAQLGADEQGISLEEVLQALGLSRALPAQFTKSFRDRWTGKGHEERIRGIGLR